MQRVSKDPLDTSSEFIEPGKSLKTSSKKKGGPYSKDEKTKRLDEVYRLHFEYGYSARKISELMNINRNTINGDVDYWYVKIYANSNSIEPDISVILNLQRFDIQRTRLRESLEKAENFQQRHAIEKMIFDIDVKIVHIQMNLANSMKRTHKLGITFLNNWLKDNGKDNRYLTYFDIISVSEKANEEISKIIEEDKKKTRI
jgi:hypothetical protein